MKKIANKVICLLLTLVMLLGVLPLAGLGTLRAKAANADVPAVTAGAGEPVTITTGTDAAAPALTPRRAAATDMGRSRREKTHEDRMEKPDHAADLSPRIPHKARGQYRHLR